MRSFGLACAVCLCAAQAFAQEPPVVALDYECEHGARLVLAYDRAADLVYGSIEGRAVLLDHVRSGSGARYIERDAADRGGRYELWMKGDGAMLNWSTEAESVTLLMNCKLPE